LVCSVVDNSEQATVSDDVAQQWQDTDAVDGKVLCALIVTVGGVDAAQSKIHETKMAINNTQLERKGKLICFCGAKTKKPTVKTTTRRGRATQCRQNGTILMTRDDVCLAKLRLNESKKVNATSLYARRWMYHERDAIHRNK